MIKGKRVYAVKRGRNPGLYYSREECQEQVIQIKKAEYKSFKNVDEAEEYILDIKLNKSNEKIEKEEETEKDQENMNIKTKLFKSIEIADDEEVIINRLKLEETESEQKKHKGKKSKEKVKKTHEMFQRVVEPNEIMKDKLHEEENMIVQIEVNLKDSNEEIHETQYEKD